MARVDYQGSPDELTPTQAPGDYQHIQANPAAFGGGLAQGAEAVGQGLEKTGDFFAQVQTDDAVNGAMEQVNHTLDGFRALSGRAALDAQADTRQQINEHFQTAREGLKTPMQRKQFDDVSRAYRMRYVDGIMATHADQQAKAYRASVTDASTVVNLTGVANVADNDEQVKHFLADQQRVERQKVYDAGNGSDPKLLDAADIRAARAVYKTQADTVGITDPVRALKIVDDHKDIFGLEYAQLSSQLRARAEQQQAIGDADKYLRRMESPAQPGAPLYKDVGFTPATGPSSNSLGNVKTPAGAAKGTQEFQQPETPIDGVVLAANNLRSGYQGLTLQQIANKWAPASDGNNPQQWAATVSKVSGLAPDQVPNLNDPTQLSGVLNGIAAAEKSASDRAKFTPAVLDQGVKAALSGASPKMRKADMLLDESSALAQIRLDYRDNPQLGNKVAAEVSKNYAIVKMKMQSDQLQAQEHVNQTVRGLTDMVFKNPTQDVEPILDAHPELTGEQAMYIRNLRATTLQNQLTGKGEGYGDGISAVQQRILNPSAADPIHSRAQLLDEYGKGHLTATGLEKAGQWLDWASKADIGERNYSSLFYKAAEHAVTLEEEDSHWKVPGSEQQWLKAVSVLNNAVDHGRAKGLTDQQMMNPESKDSVWPLLQPYLPPKGAKLKAAIEKDASAAKSAIDWRKIDKLDAAQDAYNKHQITAQQARTLWDAHPEWSAAPTANAATSGPQVPAGGQ